MSALMLRLVGNHSPRKRWVLYLQRVCLLKEEPSNTLRVAKLSEHAFLPTHGSKLAAGFDLYSAYDYTIAAGARIVCKTDIQVAVPEGTYGRVAPRSGKFISLS